MGRTRRPVEDRLATGSYYRPSRHGLPPEEPAAPDEKLTCPKSLTGRAAEVWREQVKLLAGIVRRRDVPVLAELCRWVERSERIAEKLDAIDVTDPAFRSLLVSAGIATDKVAALAKVFGLNPTDRAKVRGAESGPAKPKVATRPRTKLDGEGQ